MELILKKSWVLKSTLVDICLTDYRHVSMHEMSHEKVILIGLLGLLRAFVCNEEVSSSPSRKVKEVTFHRFPGCKFVDLKSVTYLMTIGEQVVVIFVT